jgi:hypothetical protein
MLSRLAGGSDDVFGLNVAMDISSRIVGQLSVLLGNSLTGSGAATGVGVIAHARNPLG